MPHAETRKKKREREEKKAKKAKKNRITRNKSLPMYSGCLCAQLNPSCPAPHLHLYPVGVGKTVKSAHRQGLGPAHGTRNLVSHWLRQRPEKTKRGARTTARKCTSRAFRGQRASAPARTAPCGAGCPSCLYKKTSPAASLFHLQGYSSTVVPFPP
ncbi:predicted protein [Clavispora lusitaniae ATCC 42720]|uniref:Uncharacterized protein n=1 Tax=Clavispora lusitaniae (strain ATCC 42720) TaxID=306902 RepID=C4Y352_CLAL4|nr:uncharacterized protein CLUG_02965 [Clavispora lusitaniae ATCC 42720]EEQ38839.1 predicted protein [Clavispora lusitaniae ATCC 42720]